MCSIEIPANDADANLPLTVRESAFGAADYCGFLSKLKSTTASVAGENEIVRIKDIPGYEGAYAVSDHGHVFALYRTWRGPSGELKWAPSRVLRGIVDAKGYHRVALSRDDGERNHGVHRLVAAAFCEPYTGETVNHIDGNQLNNHHSNLEWCPGEVNLMHEHLRKKRVFLTATQIMDLLKLSETVPTAFLCMRFNTSPGVVSKLLRDYRARRRQQCS